MWTKRFYIEFPKSTIFLTANANGGGNHNVYGTNTTPLQLTYENRHISKKHLLLTVLNVNISPQFSCKIQLHLHERAHQHTKFSLIILS